MGFYFLFLPPTLFPMPSSTPTALGGSAFYNYIIQKKRPMEHSPWALKPFTNPNQDVF